MKSKYDARSPQPSDFKPIYNGTVLMVTSRPCYFVITEKSSETWRGMVMKYAISKTGHLYIGDSSYAHHLVKRYGISIFENAKGKIEPNSVASIGYSVETKKWFGWSHRAIHAFKNKKDAIRFALGVS